MKYARSLAIVLLGLALSQAPTASQGFGEGSAATADNSTIAATLVATNVSSKPLRGIPSAPKTAAPRDELLEIATSFKAGERYRLEVTDTQRRMRNGATEFSITVEFRADLVVSEVVGGVTVLELTFGPPTVQNTSGGTEADMALTLYNMFDGKRLLYRTNDKGAVTGLVNSNEVGKVFNDIVDQMLRLVRRESNDPLAVAAFRAGFDPMRRGAYMEDLALELPKLVHFFSGLALDARKKYSRPKMMYPRINGTAVPSKLEYNLAWFDRTKQVAWLSWSQAADPVRTAEVVEAFMRGLVASAGQRLPLRFDFGASGASEGAIYELDLNTGLPKRIAFYREIEMVGSSVSQSVQIRVLP